MFHVNSVHVKNPHFVTEFAIVIIDLKPVCLLLGQNLLLHLGVLGVRGGGTAGGWQTELLALHLC